MHRRAGKGLAIFIVLLAIAGAAAVIWFNGGFGRGVAPPAASSTLPPAREPEADPSPRPSLGTRPPRGSGGNELSGTIFDMEDDGSTLPPRSDGERPTAVAPRPSVDLAALEAAAKRAEIAFKQSLDRTTNRLKRTRPFAARQKEVEALEQTLLQARATGTPQQKLDASAAWNKARLALEKDLQAAALKDPAVAKADAARKRAMSKMQAAGR